MRIISAEFAAGATSPRGFPHDGLPEVALIGRSNVGKSSLINALLNRKKLAHTSSTPGKTRTVNFYRINGGFYLVDLPGFGYAKAPGKVRGSWEKMMDGYFRGRTSIKGAVVILDPRRDVGVPETELLGWIGSLGISAIIVMTKTDKLSRNELSKRASIIKRALRLDDPVMFSSVTGEGRVDLFRKIEGLLKGNPPRHEADN